jgi:hypothetical protein
MVSKIFDVSTFVVANIRHASRRLARPQQNASPRHRYEFALAVVVAQASGTVKSRVTVLMTPEDVDQAVQRKVEFRPPE